MKEGGLKECPQLLPVPDLVKKCPWIPDRSSYRGVYEDDFWNQVWAKNFHALNYHVLIQWIPNYGSDSVEAWVKPTRLFDLASRLSYPGMDSIVRICQGLREGFRIGAQGASRLPLEANNWQSTFEHGPLWVDAVQQW